MKKLIYASLVLGMVACSGNKSEKKETPAQTPKAEAKVEKQSPETKYPEANESEMIALSGGTFIMGSNTGLPQEKPEHKVSVKAFKMDKSPVTVAQFSAFIQATGYQTEAERFGDSGVFSLEKQSWELLKGAYWKKPFGPKGPDAEHNHPVVHVSWNDASAYAKWKGKRLPTEAEWEFAARSGKNLGNKFSWGNQVEENGQYFANTWQGSMSAPETKDGFLYTCPVGTFGANEAGFTDMGGNVWQWCADNYKGYPGGEMPIQENPEIKVIRGGSFFYDQYGEDSFSVSGRSMNSHETSLFNTGFRCAMDL